MRYCTGLSGNRGAQRFDKNNDDIIRFSNRLLDRFLRASEGWEKEIASFFHDCIDKWHSMAQSDQNHVLVYENRKSAQFKSLICSFDEPPAQRPDDPWRTLNSMRNVDSESMIHVRGERNDY
jgi:hypothetical protein